jgi:hypothetical protein
MVVIFFARLRQNEEFLLRTYLPTIIPVKFVLLVRWLVLLMEETEGHRENHRAVASHRQTLSHNVVHLALNEIQTHNISGDRH